MKFTLPLPPSINQTYGVKSSYRPGGKLYKKKIATDWEQKAGWILKTAINKNGLKKILPFKSDIKIEICYYYSRNRDWDAGNKILCDLLEDMQIYINDMQIVEAHVTKRSDPGDPRVDVTINEI